MRPVASVIAAFAVSLAGTAAAQQAQAPETEAPEEEARQGVPVSPHQEEALRDIEGDLMERLDENEDGAISWQEAQDEQWLRENWNEYDRDGDQELDSQEVAAIDAPASTEQDARAEAPGRTEDGLPVTEHQQEVIAGELLEQLDQDGDGKISQQEAQDEERLNDAWERLDENDDGMLDAIELSQLEE